MKTPLRYPGGKSRAVKTLMEFVPEDCGELCSPFLGGGSFELALAERGIRVYGYDLFRPLVWFWRALLAEPLRIANESDKLRTGPNQYEHKGELVWGRGLLRQDFERIREELRQAIRYPGNYNYANAAKFYAINRSSFSGATFSGGWSERASYARFTDTSIERLHNFNEPNLTVEQKDFKQSIPAHPDALLYLDPPYMLGADKDKLYGDKGNTHFGFDHHGLYDIISQRSNWILSYNDCAEIRELYKDYNIVEAKWAMGMKNVKSKTQTEKKKMGNSSEIIITCLP
jgi:DNA adenine methylase